METSNRVETAIARDLLKQRISDPFVREDAGAGMIGPMGWDCDSGRAGVNPRPGGKVPLAVQSSLRLFFVVRLIPGLFGVREDAGTAGNQRRKDTTREIGGVINLLTEVAVAGG